MTRTLLVILFAATLLTAQTTQTPAPPAHPGHSMAEHHEHMQAMCKQMMQEHVADMKNMSQTLNTNLAQMKSTLPMISDINERNRWQTNISMWQALADHFNKMSQHAEHMQSMGMGCDMMEHGMMGHGMDKEETKPAAPPSK